MRAHLTQAGTRRSLGGAKHIAIWVLLAAAFGVFMAIKLYRSGNTNLSYVLAMSIAAVVGIALVAPSRFSGEHREPGDWSRELKELRQRRENPTASAISQPSAGKQASEGNQSARGGDAA
jgi:hypothetical protein